MSPFQNIASNLDTRLFHKFFHYPTSHINPHPNDDTKFLLSSHGINYLMFCPFGTKFDTKLSICIYDWTAKNNVSSVDSATKDEGCSIY